MSAAAPPQNMLRLCCLLRSWQAFKQSTRDCRAQPVSCVRLEDLAPLDAMEKP